MYQQSKIFLFPFLMNFQEYPISVHTMFQMDQFQKQIQDCVEAIQNQSPFLI